MNSYCRRRASRLALILIVLSCSLGAVQKPKKPAQKPGPPASLAVIDPIVKKAIEDHQIPGAVVLVGHNGRVVYRKAFGQRSLEPRRETMTLDTIFDMASLTKSMATATSVMRLVELGQVRLNDPVIRYIPEFGKNGKEEITVRQLLTHYSGLREDLDLKQPWTSTATAFRMAMDEKPVHPPGARFLYSDINYIVLGFLVERVSGLPLDKYAQVHIYEPLKMTRTRFVPPENWLAKIAPTEYDERGAMLRGVVHDPTARRMGGVAGHAGLFSTGDDVAKFAQALLDRKTILSPVTIEKMTTPEQPPNATSVRGFGWDLDTPFSTNRGDLLPVGSFGHTGFTGTSLWIDPTTKAYIIILTNSVHPRNKGGGAVALRTKLATAVAAALKLTPSEEAKARLVSITGYNDAAASVRRIAARNGKVKTGIDVLEQRNFSLFQDGRKKRIGVVTNQTGFDAEGRRTIDVLKAAPGVELAAIFSPEHGVTGKLDVEFGNTVDAATGVPVYSVYGDTPQKRRPPVEILKTLDAVIYDIQDAGVRFYTYETTLGYFVEAAAQAGIELIVLDRPNPITGSFVQGPMSEAGKESFVNYMPEPVRQGMTVGELAKMFNGERHLNAKLTVIPMEGWVRGDWFDSTGLLWTMPSPNLRTLNATTLYPGVCLIEGTNVSVGRGTDLPFEVFGAPWIKPIELADYLNARQIQGVRFVPTSFTPAAGSKFGGQSLGGVYMVVTDRNTLDSPELGVELAVALRKLYPNEFQIDQMIWLLNNQAVFDAIKAGQDPRRIAEDWRDPLEQFKEIRKKYLIY